MVALSVPLVLAIVFIVMNAMGLDLHRITLGALIIALGLLVDDAIIAVEMMVVKMEQGWDRVRAASFAWDITAFPMLTGTLVTAAGFLPVGFANSAVGEYAGGIFWVVALVAGRVVVRGGGVHALPRREAAAELQAARPGARSACDLRDAHLSCAAPRDRMVRRAPAQGGRSPPSAIFALAIVGFGRVQQQFFPLSERPELFFQLRCRRASSIAATTLQAVEEAEALLKGDADVATYTAYVGQGAPRFWLGLNPQLPNPSFAEIVILSKDIEARERIKARLEQAVADGALSRGAGAGRPLQLRPAGRAFRCSSA